MYIAALCVKVAFLHGRSIRNGNSPTCRSTIGVCCKIMFVQLTDRAHSHKSNLLCPGMDNSFIVATNGIQTLLLISSYCPFLSSKRVYGSAIYQSAALD